MKFLLPAVAGMAVIVDQVSKWIAYRALSGAGSVPVIDGFFHLTLVQNKGVAFGLLHGKPYLFIIISALTAVLVFYLFRKAALKGMFFNISAGLIAGGAAGNLVDRAWHGYVIDFFDFRVWPVFNFADTAITVGTALLLFCIVRSGE